MDPRDADFGIVRGVSGQRAPDVARDLAERLLAAHAQEEILAVGLHGSGVRRDGHGTLKAGATDREVSVVTTGEDVQVLARALRYQGLVVGVSVIPADLYLDKAAPRRQASHGRSSQAGDHVLGGLALDAAHPDVVSVPLEADRRPGPLDLTVTYDHRRRVGRVMITLARDADRVRDSGPCPGQEPDQNHALHTVRLAAEMPIPTRRDAVQTAGDPPLRPSPVPWRVK